VSRAVRIARDLVEDRGMRIINLSFGLLAVLSLAIPFGLGWLPLRSSDWSGTSCIAPERQAQKISVRAA
jgi:hypothetical protein